MQKPYPNSFRSALKGIGVGVFAAYLLWWLFVAVGVILIVNELLQIGLIHWIHLNGWRFWYGMAGAFVLAYVLIRVTPTILREWIALIRTNPFYGVIAIVVAGVIPYIFIPLIVVGWPIVVWLLWSNRDPST